MELVLTLAAFLRASSCSFLWKKFRQKKAWPLGSLLLRGVIESPRAPPHSSEILAVSQKSKSWPVHLSNPRQALVVCIFLDAFPYGRRLMTYVKYRTVIKKLLACTWQLKLSLNVQLGTAQQLDSNAEQ